MQKDHWSVDLFLYDQNLRLSSIDLRLWRNLETVITPIDQQYPPSFMTVFVYNISVYEVPEKGILEVVWQVQTELT